MQECIQSLEQTNVGLKNWMNPKTVTILEWYQTKPPQFVL